MKRRKYFCSLFLLTALLFSACSGDPKSPTTTTETDIQTVKKTAEYQFLLSPNSISVIHANDTLNLDSLTAVSAYIQRQGKVAMNEHTSLEITRPVFYNRIDSVLEQFKQQGIIKFQMITPAEK